MNGRMGQIIMVALQGENYQTGGNASEDEIYVEHR